MVSGRLSKFFLSYSPNKISYNLFAVIEDGCAKGQGLVSVSCVFGCPYSDITSYDYLYHKYGKAVVVYKGERMSFVTLMKKVLYSERKCTFKFQLDVSSVKKFEQIRSPIEWQS